jgi:hypothetical protein
MRHHFRHPQAMYHKGSLFYSHCAFQVGGRQIQFSFEIPFYPWLRTVATWLLHFCPIFDKKS